MYKSKIILPLIVFTIIFITYIPAIHTEFLCDDYGFSPLYGASPTELWNTLKSIHYGDIRIYPFRPIAFISYIIDYNIYGWNASRFHLTNILIHCFNALLVLWLFTLFKIPILKSSLGALLFGLFPAFSEPVIWISGRFDLLACTFMLLSIIFYIKKNWNSLLFFLLALLSKENVIIGFLVLPFIDFILKRKIQWKMIIGFSIPIIIFACIRILLYGGISGDLSISRNVPMYDMSYSLYVKKLVQDINILSTPMNINVFDYRSMTVYSIILKCIFAVSVFLSIIYKKYKFVLLTIAWFLVFIFPTFICASAQSNLVQTRYLYLPFIGILFSIIPIMNIKKALIPTIILLLSFFFILSCNNQVWIDATPKIVQITDTIENNIPDINDGDIIVLVDIPWLYKGTFFAPNGYASYIEYKYNKSIECYHTHTISPEYADKYIVFLWENELLRRIH